MIDEVISQVASEYVSVYAEEYLIKAKIDKKQADRTGLLAKLSSGSQVDEIRSLTESELINIDSWLECSQLHQLNLKALASHIRKCLESELPNRPIFIQAGNRFRITLIFGSAITVYHFAFEWNKNYTGKMRRILTIKTNVEDHVIGRTAGKLVVDDSVLTILDTRFEEISSLKFETFEAARNIQRHLSALKKD